MKILAQGNSKVWIVEATSQELARVLGFFWEGEDRCPRLGVGNEIKVDKLYERNREVSALLGTLDSCVGDLRKAADLVESASNVEAETCYRRSEKEEDDGV